MINWGKRHSFWAAIILIIAVSFVLEVFGVLRALGTESLGLYFGLGVVIFLWALWKAGKWRHKRQRFLVSVFLAVSALALGVGGVIGASPIYMGIGGGLFLLLVIYSWFEWEAGGEKKQRIKREFRKG